MSIVIIGSGMAATALVRETRKLDKDTPIVMITADDGVLYAKPMLSNAFAQNKTPEDLRQKNANQFAEEQGVTLMTSSEVIEINRVAKTVLISTPFGDDTIDYDSLVLATGATPRPYLGLPSVNSLKDYAHWRKNMSPGQRVLIVGAGLIGAEFANDLAGAGFDVHVVDPAPTPLGRLLPAAMGERLGEALTASGIHLHMARTIEAVSSNVALLDDGTEIVFDHALSAIGLIPNTGLAAAAGLEVNSGICVDSLLRTSDSAIYAMGDGAETLAGVLPFVLPLMAQARALAKTLCGQPTPLHLPALPVVVKTPALPVVVCPPKPGAQGAWVQENDNRAIYQDDDGQPLGFALSGSETVIARALAREMPDLLGV